MLAFATSGRISEEVPWILAGSSVWGRKVSSDQTEVVDGTHVKDLKNPVEVRPPGDDPLLVLPRVKKSRDGIQFAPLDKLPLNLCHGPTIESILLNNSKRVSPVQLTPLAGLSHPAQTD